MKESLGYALFEYTNVKEIWNLIGKALRMNIEYKEVMFGLYEMESSTSFTINNILVCINYATFKINNKC